MITDCCGRDTNNFRRPVATTRDLRPILTQLANVLLAITRTLEQAWSIPRCWPKRSSCRSCCAAKPQAASVEQASGKQARGDEMRPCPGKASVMSVIVDTTRLQ